MSDADPFAYKSAWWPMPAAGLAVLVGCSMLVTAWLVGLQAQEAVSALHEPSADTDRQTLLASAAVPDFLPSLKSKNDDIRALHAVASQKQISLTSIDFRTESDTRAGVQLENVDIRVEDEYAKVKSFLSAAMAAQQNLYLRDFELQRAGAEGAVRVRGTVRLTLAYRAATPSQPQ